MIHLPPSGVAPQGISAANRNLLEKLHRAIERPVDVHDAARILDLDLARTRRLLRYLAERGWLARVRRGFYIPVPLEASDPSRWTEDPWIVAARVFRPSYVAGWTACEYWGFTEQLFREVMVITAKRIRERTVTMQGTPYMLKVVPEWKLFGTQGVWRGQVRVDVASPARTVVDILDDPAMGGGIRTVADILVQYFASDHRDDAAVIEMARRLGNRSVFKRFGYLVEILDIDAPHLVATCRSEMSTGITALDPSVKSRGRIDSRWGLAINVAVAKDPES